VAAVAELGSARQRRDVKKSFGILGVLTILFWLSLAPDLYRLWIWREYSGADLWYSVALICAGVISGALLLSHPRVRRIVAITLCSGMLALHAWSYMRSYPHIGDRLYCELFIFMPSMPVYFVYHEIVAAVFFIATIVFLVRRSSA
jgi:hypothetical protein